MTDVPVKSEVVAPSALGVVPPVPVIPNVPLPNVPLPNIPFPIIPIPGLQGSPLPPLEKPKSRSIRKKGLAQKSVKRKKAPGAGMTRRAKRKKIRKETSAILFTGNGYYFANSVIVLK